MKYVFRLLFCYGLFVRKGCEVVAGCYLMLLVVMDCYLWLWKLDFVDFLLVRE